MPLSTASKSGLKKVKLLTDLLIDSGENVLEVGCGDGSFFDVIKKNRNLKVSSYVGMDISDEMINLATLKNANRKNCKFLKCKFQDYQHPEGQILFDTVIFNGVFQFFPESEFSAVLKKASEILLPQESSSVILCHANGGSFVNEEKRLNPSLVRSAMPDISTVEQWSRDMSWSKLEYGDDLDRFYWYARKTPPPQAKQNKALPLDCIHELITKPACFAHSFNQD